MYTPPAAAGRGKGGVLGGPQDRGIAAVEGDGWIYRERNTVGYKNKGGFGGSWLLLLPVEGKGMRERGPATIFQIPLPGLPAARLETLRWACVHLLLRVCVRACVRVEEWRSASPRHCSDAPARLFDETGKTVRCCRA